VSGYELDNREIEVRFPEEAKDFSCSFCVQTALGPTQSPVHWVQGVPFSEGKARPRRDADHSPLCSAEVVID
jgi:hypothetical protein